MVADPFPNVARCRRTRIGRATTSSAPWAPSPAPGMGLEADFAGSLSQAGVEAIVGLAHIQNVLSYFSICIHLNNSNRIQNSEICRNSNKFEKTTKPILLFELSYIL
jgi:hypothetical protein